MLVSIHCCWSDQLVLSKSPGGRHLYDGRRRECNMIMSLHTQQSNLKVWNNNEDDIHVLFNEFPHRSAWILCFQPVSSVAV